MSQLNEILLGWGNVVKDKIGILDLDTKQLAESRLLICNSCYLRVGNTCSPKMVGYNTKTKELKKGCGCNISAKTLSPQSKCPLDKW
jgi:hypothetical protein